MNCPFQFSLEFTGPEKQPLGQFPIDPDWLPAEEALRFEMLRQGRDMPLRGNDIDIIPHWSESGAPFVASFSVIAAGAPAVPLPVSFFRPEARKIEKILIGQEKLKEQMARDLMYIS